MSEKSERRHAHLASAFRRGVPYRVLELSTRPDNRPNVFDLFQALAGKKRREALLQRDKEEVEITLAPLHKWLEGSAPTRLVAAHEAVRKSYIDAKQARREAYRTSRVTADLVH